MYRHLYKKPSIVSRVLQSEFQNYRCEDLGFRNAALAKLREYIQNGQSQEEFIQYWEDLHLLDLHEHWEISKSSVLPQLYRMFSTLHGITRQQPIIRYPQIEQISKFTSLLDPDMFPVQNLKEKIRHEVAVSIWENGQITESSIIDKVEQKLGFVLQVKQSSIDHIEAGNGVFLLPCGTLLGLVPGVIYNSYQDLEDPDQNVETHFFRFDGTIFNFEEKIFYPVLPSLSKEQYESKIQNLHEMTKEQRSNFRDSEKGGFERVFGFEVNPFAVGHLINHTPVDKSTNVVLVDIFIPKSFFPENLMRFWPSINQTVEKDYMAVGKHKHKIMRHYMKNHVRGLGVMSVAEIKDGEELYLDYIDSSLFEISQNPPDWLVQPPPLSPFITKGHFENKFTWINELVENKLFNQSNDGNNYSDFIKKVNREKQYIDTITK